MQFKLFAVAAVSAFALAACSPATETPPVEPAAIEEPAIDPVVEEPVPAPTTIIDIAAANPDVSTLMSALEAAGLTETLAGPGPYTVFAPTTAAFAALPAGELDSLLLPENKDKLVRILSYHVVAGNVMAADIAPADAGVATPSLNNLDLSVRTEPDGSVKVNQATVTQADIAASNGVIHVIDTVLMPRMEE